MAPRSPSETALSSIRSARSSRSTPARGHLMNEALDGERQAAATKEAALVAEDAGRALVGGGAEPEPTPGGTPPRVQVSASLLQAERESIFEQLAALKGVLAENN